MLEDFKNAFSDVFDKKIRPLMLKIVLLTGGVWAVVLYAFWFALGTAQIDSSPVLSKSVQILGFIGVVIASLFFLPVLLSAVAGFFTESLVKSLNTGSNLTFKEPSAAQSLKISGVSALKSLLSGSVFLPLTLLLGLIPVLNFVPPLVYCFVNGRVFAYEYFFSTALCLLNENEAQRLYDENKSRFNKAGMIIAALMMIPVMNIFAPLIASAFMQRQIVRLTQKEKP